MVLRTVMPRLRRRRKLRSCSNGNGFAPHLDELETAQQSFDRSRRSLAVEALQYLTQHQVAHDDVLRTQEQPQLLDVRCIPAIEEVDPDGAVDNNGHPVPRPVRLRARFPCH